LGVLTNSKTTIIDNAGSISGAGGTAVLLGGANNLFVMDGPLATLAGIAIGSGSDTFRLAGTGANSFNLSQIGAGWTAFDKAGSSNWTLTGTATYAGPTTVSAGTLLVNGSLVSSSGLTVNAGATVGGSGTLPKTTINGGTLSPGNSIGTIAISGSLTFVGPGTYLVEVSPAAADKTNVSGSAILAGAVQVNAVSGGVFAPKHYTILNAASISGTFGSFVVNGDFGPAVKNPHLEYDAGNVYFVLDPNAISPLLVGGTPNQKAVASAIDTAFQKGVAPPLFLGLFNLTAAQLPGALDQLSGEVHASTAGVLVDESLYARAAVLGRLRQASYGGDASMASLSMGGPMAFANGEELSALAYGKSPIVTKAPPMVSQPRYDVVFWAQGFGARGKFDGDGNATSLRRDLAGFFTGADTRVGSDGRLGIGAGYTASRNNLDGRGSANVETGHLMGYGGWRFGALNLRAGGAYAWHTIDTDRTIAFPGFFDRATAHYNGGTGQIFGEAGYGFAFGKIAVEPFAGAAWVHLKTDAFNERGGAAALTVAASAFEVGYSTLGIRAASMIPLAADMMLVPRVSVAWQHAFNDVTPTAVLAFQNAAAPFVIAGVPIARDSLLAEAGLDLAIGLSATLGLSYVGQLARNVQDHAAKGKFSWKF
jgi:outer membrane autotransporter protein